MSDKSQLDWAGAWLHLHGTPRCVYGQLVSVPDCYSLTALELLLKCCWKLSLWVSSTKWFQHFFLDFLTVLNDLFVCGDITAIPALQKMSFSKGLLNAEGWQKQRLCTEIRHFPWSMCFSSRDEWPLEQAAKGGSVNTVLSFSSGQGWIICWQMYQVRVTGVDAVVLDRIERICDYWKI